MLVVVSPVLSSFQISHPEYPSSPGKRRYVLGCAVGCRIATRSFYSPLASVYHNPPRQEKKTHLQHMQQGRLSGIIKTEEEKLGVLVEKTQRGQNVVD